MLRSLIVVAAGSLLLLGSTNGQDSTKVNCNFNQDTIFFENEELEKLRAAFQFGGDCSPFSWIDDFVDYTQNNLRDARDIQNLSDRDRTLMNDFAKRRSSKNQDQEDIALESASQGVGEQPPLKSSDQSRTTSGDIELEEQRRFQYERTPSNGYSERQRNSERPGIIPGLFRPEDQLAPGSDFIRPTDQGRPLNQGEIFPRYSPTPEFQGRPEEFFGCHPEYPNQGRFDIFRPKGRRRPTNQDIIFPSVYDRRPQSQSRPEDFYEAPGGSQNQQQPETFVNFRPQRRPQNNNRPDFLRPNSQRRPPTRAGLEPEEQRKPQPNELPDNFIMPDSLPKPQSTSSTTTPPSTSTMRPGPPTWATPPSLCVRRCPNTPEYNPVCGSDNVSYVNPGRLRCEQGCGKENVSLRHYGNCG